MEINAGIELYRTTENAVLLDVRTRREYAKEHIEDAVNVPVHKLGDVLGIIPDKSMPLFVYCRCGKRAGLAVKKLKKIGYENVKNIGGIKTYCGETPR